MIYQFTEGPNDGMESDIPEIPIGGVFLVPIPVAACIEQSEVDFLMPAIAKYRVTDIGEMAFSGYE